MSAAVQRDRWAFGLLAVLACAAGLLVLRNWGLHPTILPDEWNYNQMARMLPLGEATVPSYLYLWLFGASNVCGTGFLECVRLGNVLLFAASAPFVYLVGRKVTGRWPAAFIALLCVLGPSNIFTTFFMPEPAYFFGFWAFTWLVLARSHLPAARYGLLTGAALGILSLVKVHALFLLPPLCGFIVYLHWSGAGRGLRAGLLAAMLAVGAALAVRLGLGYVLAGAPALDVFGPFYAKAATPKVALSTVLHSAFVYGRAHAMALALVLPLPLAIVLFKLLRPSPRATAGAPRNLLQVYALLMLAAMAVVSVAFTSWYDPITGAPILLRVHLRYYSFVFPLLMLVAAAPAEGDEAPGRAKLRWAIALALAAAIALALLKLPLYAVNAFDAPEVAALGLHPVLGWTVAATGLLVLFLWARADAMARPLFVYAALPLTLACAYTETVAFLNTLKPEFAPEKAAAFARVHVPKAEHALIAVAADSFHELQRVQFYVDNRDIAGIELAKDAPLQAYQLPTHSKWLLVIGRHALPPGLQPVMATADYELVPLQPSGPHQ